LDGGYAEVFVALEEASSGGGDAGGCVAGNSGVAIDDEIVVGSDAVGVDLGGGKRGGGKRGDGNGEEDSRESCDDAPVRGERGGSGLGKNKVGDKKHGCTS
jgi:hypothetical protein